MRDHAYGVDKTREGLQNAKFALRGMPLKVQKTGLGRFFVISNATFVISAPKTHPPQAENRM
jgi:hypothetical protein